MSPIGHPIPRQRVPELSLLMASGGSWRLSDQKPKHFTMLAFYRGVHCSVCTRNSVSRVSRRLPFRRTTQSARARPRQAGGLQDLCVAYGLSLRQAREWGLYVSRGCGRSSLGIEEPPMFVEPALFLVRPDRTLYYASVQSMPFGRPCFEEMLSGIEKAVARNYPARGEIAD
jgi:hypothetical protein